MTAIKFRNRTFERIIELRETLRACEHAAGVVARFCPAADVEAYVRTCVRAERIERLTDWCISAVSAFAAPIFMLVIDGGPGLLAALLFIALWAFFGVGQLMTHKTEQRTDTVARAVSKLCEAVTWSPEELAAHGVTLTINPRRGFK
jgi:hypothetical protein